MSLDWNISNFEVFLINVAKYYCHVRKIKIDLPLLTSDFVWVFVLESCWEVIFVTIVRRFDFIAVGASIKVDCLHRMFKRHFLVFLNQELLWFIALHAWWIANHIFRNLDCLWVVVSLIGLFPTERRITSFALYWANSMQSSHNSLFLHCLFTINNRFLDCLSWIDGSIEEHCKWWHSRISDTELWSIWNGLVEQSTESTSKCVVCTSHLCVVAFIRHVFYQLHLFGKEYGKEDEDEAKDEYWDANCDWCNDSFVAESILGKRCVKYNWASFRTFDKGKTFSRCENLDF